MLERRNSQSNMRECSKLSVETAKQIINKYLWEQLSSPEEAFKMRHRRVAYYNQVIRDGIIFE